jgi:ABC-type polysaccharide/polyol phosphate export permease
MAAGDGVGEMNILLIMLAVLTAAFLTIISLIIIALSIGYRDLNEEEQ